MMRDDRSTPDMQSASFFPRYTSTTALAEGDDESILEWSIGYFNANFARLLPADNKHAAILEVACGYGRYLKALAGLGYMNCTGIDISDEQIAYARNKLGLNNVVKVDAFEWLRGKKEQFDLILAIDFLEHVPTADLISLGQLFREALKPGGRLIIQVPNGISPVNPMIYGDLTHVRAFTIQSIRQFFLHAGFRSYAFYSSRFYVYNWKTRMRYYAWKLILNPAIHLFSLIAHGKLASGIYTSNIISVAEKGSA